MFKRGSHCHGVEYKWGHCELWKTKFSFTHYAPGFFCFHYSSTPVVLQGVNDDHVLVVKPDASLSSSHAETHSAFHKITHDDATVSFLSHGGKFLSARPDGSIKAVADGVDVWEKFTETRNGVSNDGHLETALDKGEHIRVTPITATVRLFDAQHTGEHPPPSGPPSLRRACVSSDLQSGDPSSLPSRSSCN